MNEYRRRCLRQKLNVCNICGSTENLLVHHIDGNRDNNSLSNLLPVCGSCHGKIHSSKEYQSEVIEMYTNHLPDSAINDGPNRKPKPNMENPLDRITCQAHISKNGYATLPIQSRRVLGIKGESANVNLEVEVIEE